MTDNAEKYTIPVHLRMRPSDMAKIESLADAERTTPGHFIRRAAVQDADRRQAEAGA